MHKIWSLYKMRIHLILLIIVLTIFFSIHSNKKINNPQKEPMQIYNGNITFVDNMLAELPEQRSTIFYSQNGDTKLVLYCNDTEMYRYGTESTYTHLLINGIDYILDSFGKSFYLREVSVPNLFWHDINKDGVPDFILECGCDRYGMLQYAFVSTKEGNYKNLGSVSWNTNGSGNLSYENFPYTVTLLDDYKVKVELVSAGINETYRLSRKEGDFLEDYAIPFALYDETGKVTDLGKIWDFTSNGLYESDISYQIDNVEVVISIKTYINAGYSTADIGCGFVLDWKVTEAGYELLTVTTFMD